MTVRLMKPNYLLLIRVYSRDGMNARRIFADPTLISHDRWGYDSIGGG